MANVHTCFDMFWQVVSMTNPLPEHYIDTPNNWLQNTTTRSNKRQKVSVKGTGKYHSGDQNNWFILEDREIYLRRSVHAYYWYVFFLCVCVCRSICVHLISWSIGIQLCIYIYIIYTLYIYKYAQKYYLTICFRWLLSPAPTVGGEQRRLRGTLLPGLEHDGNRALHLHLSERRPGFLGWMKAGIQSDRCFYQWIPGKTKRPKKTKRLGGSKALHLIWGIFCFAEAVFVFWCVFVVILVFPFSLFEIVLGWVHCFDFNTCERKALAKSNSKSQ